MKSRKYETGMTLIEILVTMLIVSIGLMGLASLQATSMKESLDTSQRSLGTWMADELVARMRANVQGMRDGGYTAAGANNALCNAAPAKMCGDYQQGSAAADCSASEMATYDVWEVVCGHDNGANVISGPNNSIAITQHSISCIDSDATDGDACSIGSNFNISLQWTSKAVQDATANQSNYNEDATQRIEMTVRP